MHSLEVEGEYSEEVSSTDYVGGEYSEEVRGTDYVGGEYSTADDDYENYSVYSGDVYADDEVQGGDPKSIKWIIINSLNDSNVFKKNCNNPFQTYPKLSAFIQD